MGRTGECMHKVSNRAHYVATALFTKGHVGNVNGGEWKVWCRLGPWTVFVVSWLVCIHVYVYVHVWCYWG
jgi:hypothetical protein